MVNLRKKLESGVFLFDGATGTYAKANPDWPEGAVELACITAPQMVVDLHRAYVAAGCDAIKTNTFAAHVGMAAEDAGQQARIISAAVRIACEAAGDKALVFADIGPAPADADAAGVYMQMASLFLSEGIEYFLFETLPSDHGIAQTAAMIKEKNPNAFVAVSFAADPDGFTRSGESAAALIAKMDACADVDAIGLNCICGAYHMRRLLGSMPRISKLLMAMPNAGYPHVIEGRTYYDSDPVYYAQQVALCAAQGAVIVGGCCGTTPEHIRKLAAQLRIAKSVQPHARTQEQDEEKTCPSAIRRKLDRGERVVLVELDPPRDSGIDAFLSGVRTLADAGADAITIADCPIGRARMDSSLLACKIRRELGVEALPHMTCRDRNVNATKALLLGLSMEGVHNVLAVTGDPVPTSERENIKGVFQFNSRVLARFVRSLSQSGDTEPFFLCGALNINAANFDIELQRAKDKEACGMEAFLTQPVLSEQAACNLERARGVLSGRLIGGIFPVVSEKNARFLHSEVAGITLDERIIEAYSGLDRMQSEELAVRLCLDAARRIAPFVDGFYIMTPFQRVQLVCSVMKALGGIL